MLSLLKCQFAVFLLYYYNEEKAAIGFLYTAFPAAKKRYTSGRI